MTLEAYWLFFSTTGAKTPELLVSGGKQVAAEKSWLLVFFFQHQGAFFAPGYISSYFSTFFPGATAEGFRWIWWKTRRIWGSHPLRVGQNMSHFCVMCFIISIDSVDAKNGSVLVFFCFFVPKKYHQALCRRSVNLAADVLNQRMPRLKKSSESVVNPTYLVLLFWWFLCLAWPFFFGPSGDDFSFCLGFWKANLYKTSFGWW